MIERGVIEASRGVEPGSTQGLGAQALLAVLNALKAVGFKDPASHQSDLGQNETISTLPEGAIRFPDVTIQGMSGKELGQLADSIEGLNVGDWARDIIQRAPESPARETKILGLAALDARTMGLPANYPTTEQIWDMANNYGSKVSPEAMVRLAAEVAKGKVRVEIGKPLVGIMNPMTDSGGVQDVLYLARYEGGLWLGARYADPDDPWYPDCQFVVSPRK